MHYISYISWIHNDWKLRNSKQNSQRSKKDVNFNILHTSFRKNYFNTQHKQTPIYIYTHIIEL